MGGTWWRSPGWPNPHWIVGNAATINDQSWRVHEMVAPSIPPARLRPGGGLGHITVPSSRGLGQTSTATTTAQSTGTPFSLFGLTTTESLLVIAAAAYFIWRK